MMLIYRIEDVDGGGMYRGSWPNPIGYDEVRHPIPHRDSMLCAQILTLAGLDYDPYGDESQEAWRMRSRFSEAVKPYTFGFSTVDQLRNWIYQDDWLRDMDDVGYRLSVFKIDPDFVIEGYTQAMFLRSKAQEISQHNIREFFRI